MSQYSLHPVNSVAQQLTAQPVQLGDQTQSLPPIPGLPAYQPPEPELQTGGSLGRGVESVPPDSTPVRNYARIDIPGTQLGDIPDAPVQVQPSQVLTPLVNPGPDINQQLAAAYQKMANYQTFGQRHPILGSLFGNVSGGDEANYANLQRQLGALNAVKQMQQANATNQTTLGWAGKLAQAAGLPAPVPGTVVDDKALTTLQALAQGYGAPTAIKAFAQYQQQLNNYNTVKQNLETDYQRRALAGKLTNDENKNGGPTLPAMPTLDTSNINQYLDTAKISGLTGTSGEAAKTGEDAGAHAATNATGEKEANARLAELQNQLDFQKQSHQDSIGQQEATRQQGDQHFQSELTQRQTEHQDTLQGRREQLAYKEWDDSQKGLDAISKKIDDNDKAFEQLSTKYKGNADHIRKDPAYTVINAKRKQLEAQRDQALAVSNQKLAKYRELTGEGQQQSTPAPVSSVPQVAPTGQTLHQAQPTIKIRIPRSVALKHGLIH